MPTQRAMHGTVFASDMQMNGAQQNNHMIAAAPNVKYTAIPTGPSARVYVTTAIETHAPTMRRFRRRHHVNENTL